MSTDFARVREIFLAVRHLDEPERAARMDDLCAGDDDLRDEVASLLTHDRPRSAHDHGNGAPDLLDAIVPAAAGALVRENDPERFGDFEILGRLGAGGMGIVYRARQRHPGRVVALKVLQPGAVTDQHAARFELEARLLARLQHPGIASVHEAGAIDLGAGPQPYFAMELVDGTPLDAHADDKELDVRARVALVTRVCAAVHHAHQKGIIHRDLKPANILVTEAGDPKVLDFGVARATDDDDGLQSTVARTVAGQLVGTLPYMSPEQVAGNPDAVDLRSDVYALGVILFELLAGRLPHDLDGAAFVEAARRIQHDPPLRLRGARPELHGDLETVVATALEQDPERRYGSAAMLAEDLRRYLEDRPILARPASMAHHVRLFARRHRAGVAGAALGVTSLVVATAISIGFAIAAGRSADEAAYRQLVSDRVNVHLEHMLRLPDAHRGGENVTVLELIDGVIRALDASEELPEVEATVRAAAGGSYLSLHRFEPALRHLERADALWRELKVTDARRIETLTKLAGALSETGRHARAVETHRTLIALARAPTLEQRQNFATALTRADRLDEAADMFEQILTERRAEAGDDPAALAIALRNAASLHEAREDFTTAAAFLEESLELARGENAAADDDPFIASTVLRLARIELRTRGPEAARPRFEHAWALTRDARPVGSPDWMSTAAFMIRCLRAVDDRPAVVAMITDVAERLSAALGADDFRTREAWGMLARCHDAWGEPDRAAAIRAARATSPGTRQGDEGS